MQLEAVLEGLLFVIGDEGLSSSKIKEILNVNDEELENIINILKRQYSSEKRGIDLIYSGDVYKLATKKEHKKYYELLTNVETDSTLSTAALETLAIIAYNQPITRIEVDEIRGINSSHLVRRLLLKNLIRDCGKSDSPGKPILYCVTNDFLDYFGLKSLEELPKLEEVEIEDEEKDLFESKYKEQ